MSTNQDNNAVALIGTGIMGEPMGHHLIRAGFQLHVYNRTAEKADRLVDAGARRHPTPAETAGHAAVVISCVSDSPDVEEVYLGEGGVLEGMKPGTLCVDMSTIAPSCARNVAARVAEKGGSFLDAPVSGGKTGAEAGTLSIMVGGTADDVERARPYLDAVGKSIVHGGPVGHGQLMKSCNQIICGLNLLAVSEAVVFAKNHNLDVGTMLEAVSGGAAGSWAVSNLGPRMKDRDFAPMFMIDLQQKDLGIVLNAARKSLTSLPGTALVYQLLAANQAAGEGREGTQAMVKTIERLAGMTGQSRNRD